MTIIVGDRLVYEWMRRFKGQRVNFLDEARSWGSWTATWSEI